MELLALLVALLVLNSVSSFQTLKVKEEENVGYVIANIANILKLDEATKQTLMITNPKQPGMRSLEIDTVTGELRIKRKLDRDTLCSEFRTCCSSKQALYSECKLRLQVGYRTVEEQNIQRFTLEVEDINDNAPVFTPSSVQISVAENAEEGSTRLNIPGYPAMDRDSSENGIRERGYSLEKGNGNQKAPFILDRSSRGRLKLQLVGKLDREVRSQYVLKLLAVDSGQRPNTGTLTITVNVEDVNDNTPVFQKKHYTATINENIQPGKTFLKVKATDKDTGNNAKIDYEIIDTGNGAARYFGVSRVADNVGNIFVKQHLDVDSLHLNRFRKFYVVAKDKGMPSRSAETEVTVTVRDVNDQKPRISVVYLTPNPENDDEGMVTENKSPFDVAKIEVTDMDSGLGGEVDCRTSNNAFQLKHISGDLGGSGSDQSMGRKEFLVQLTRELDREIQKKLHFQVTCTDRGEQKLADTATINIKIRDENDQSPKFDRDVYRFTLNEQHSEKKSTVIGNVRATDKDEGRNARITYSIRQDSSNQFRISKSSGQIRAVGVFDRESMLVSGSLDNPVRKFTVVARDGGKPSHEATAEVEVTIADVNDMRPRFEKEIYQFFVTENKRQSDVGTVKATDQDDPRLYHKLLYKLDKVGEKNFRIHPSKGIISCYIPLDRENVNEAFKEFKVYAVDRPLPQYSNNHVSLTGEATVKVAVRDVNDNPPNITEPSRNHGDYFVSESDPVGHQVLVVKAHDPDEGQNGQVRYTLTSGGHGMFTLDEASGTLFISKQLKNAGIKLFTLRIKAYDRGQERRNTSRIVRIRVRNGKSVTNRRQPTYPQKRNHSIYDDRAIVICLGVLFFMLLLGAGVLACFIKRKRDVERSRHQPGVQAKYHLGGPINETKLDETGLESRMLYENSCGLTTLRTTHGIRAGSESVPVEASDECDSGAHDLKRGGAVSPLTLKLGRGTCGKSAPHLLDNVTTGGTATLGRPATTRRMDSTEYQTLDGLLLADGAFKPLNSHTYYEIHAGGTTQRGGSKAIDSKHPDRPSDRDGLSDSSSNYFTDEMQIPTVPHTQLTNRQYHQTTVSQPVTPMTQHRSLQPVPFNPYSEASFV